MKIDEIKIPIYGGLLIVILCDDWAVLQEKFPALLNQYEMEDQHDGYVFSNSNQYFVAFKGIPSGSVIAHEIVHLVNLVYIDRSIPLDILNDEHQAYLTEWFFKQIENFFKEK